MRRTLKINHQSQKGAALLIAMVFLTVLAIIGISSMKNTRLEQKMSSNIQELNHAFQYAESGLSAAIANPAVINSVQTNNRGEIKFEDYDAPLQFLCDDTDSTNGTENDCTSGSNSGNAAITYKYLGQSDLLEGTSLGAGFATHFFVVGSKGVVNSRATAIHQKGFTIIGPGQE